MLTICLTISPIKPNLYCTILDFASKQKYRPMHKKACPIHFFCNQIVSDSDDNERYRLSHDSNDTAKWSSLSKLCFRMSKELNKRSVEQELARDACIRHKHTCRGFSISRNVFRTKRLIIIMSRVESLPHCFLEIWKERKLVVEIE